MGRTHGGAYRGGADERVTALQPRPDPSSRPPLHAAGQTEGRGDGAEDGDNHVDDQLPGLFLVFGTHNKLFLKGSPPFYGWNGKII